MGIESFFSSLKQNYNNIIQSDQKEIKKKIKNNIEYFFIDFNSIIHTVSSKLLSKNYKNNIWEKSNEPLKIFEEILINEIIDFLKNFFVDFNQLKLIYIAIDGVPTKSKIIEQKKRRFNAVFLEMFINQKISKNDEQFWSKNNISPGTYFMTKLSEKLKLLNKSKDLYLINYKTDIIIDDFNNVGEGEMKIMSWIRKNIINKKRDKNPENIGIYSPDSDVILISILLKAELDLISNITNNNIFFFRHDQQNKKDISDNDKIEVLLIDDFKKDYLYQIKGNENVSKEIEYRIIRDIIFILTSLGDDFVPRLEMIDANSDKTILLDLYSINYSEKKMLIEKTKRGYNINMTNYLYFLENLVKLEDILEEKSKLNKKYMFINNYLKNIATIVIEKINLISLEFKNIKNITMEEVNNILERKKDNYIEEIKNYIKKKVQYDDKIVSFNLIMLTLLNTIEKNNIPESYSSKKWYFLNNNQIISELIKFIIFSKKNINIKESSIRRFSNNFLIKKNSDPTKKDYLNMKDLNKKEKEEYLIERNLEPYYSLFNFNRDLKLYNKEDKVKRDQIVINYIEGLEWVLDFYNNGNFLENINLPMWNWYYKYLESPTISEIYNYIKRNKKELSISLSMLNIYIEKNNKRPNILKDEYFNPIELLIYITPFNYSIKIEKQLKFLRNLGKENLLKIKDFINENKNRYIYDIQKTINSIKNNLNTKNNLINCNNKRYFNKCELVDFFELQNNINDDNYIKDFRKLRIN